MFLRKHAGLAQECWFWLSTIGHFEVAGEWQRNGLCTSRKECNKYDMTAAQYF
jgi:hypothetical protein